MEREKRYKVEYSLFEGDFEEVGREDTFKKALELSQEIFQRVRWIECSKFKIIDLKTGIETHLESSQRGLRIFSNLPYKEEEVVMTW